MHPVDPSLSSQRDFNQVIHSSYNINTNINLFKIVNNPVVP